MDISKYKSLAVDHKCYEAINKLTKHLAPGVTLSRAQVIRMLVEKETTHPGTEMFPHSLTDCHAFFSRGIHRHSDRCLLWIVVHPVEDGP